MLIRLLALAVTVLVTVPAYADAPGSTLARIKDTGTITFGHRENSRPFSFVGGDGKPAGYALDLCERVADAVKDDLGLSKLNVAYKSLTAEDRFDALTDGSIDIECGASSQTLTRRETVSFSLMTFITGASLLTKADAGINGVGDLGGKKVSVVAGTTTEKAIEQRLAENHVEATVVRVKDHDEAMAMLENGQVDAHTSDQLILIGLAKQTKDPSTFALAPELFTYEPYALVLRRNDDDFRLAVDRTIAQLYRTGEIATIYEKWFGDWGGKPSRLLIAMWALNGLPE
jgi:glutamate/aspartate transport system substrate-binding protein